LIQEVADCCVGFVVWGKVVGVFCMFEARQIKVSEQVYIGLTTSLKQYGLGVAAGGVVDGATKRGKV
jgi:hypothetical protein